MNVFLMTIWTDILAFKDAEPTLFYTAVIGAVLVLTLTVSGIVILVNKRRRIADIEYAVADMQEIQRRAEIREAERQERIKKEEAERRKKERAEARARHAREKAENAGNNGESGENQPATKAPAKRRKKVAEIVPESGAVEGDNSVDYSAENTENNLTETADAVVEEIPTQVAETAVEEVAGQTAEEGIEIFDTEKADE